MKIILIGAGNVGQNLATGFKKAGHSVIQVYGKGKSRSTLLAKRIGATPLKDLQQLDEQADLIVLAVPDDAIPGVLKKIPATRQLIVHTAGNVPLTVFGSKFPNAGVLYPLQSFTSGRAIKLKNTPLLIEAKSNALARKLRSLSKELSDEVHIINSSQRQWLHLAAVISNNFTNHLFLIAAQLMQQHRLPFRLLHPLMRETVEKAIALPPAAAQTGPARRGDRTTMRKHISMLAADRKLQRLYRLMSEGIAQRTR